MATTAINLDDKLLESSAKKIETKVSEFVREYEKIYTAAEDLSIKYQGVTSQEFNKKLNSYKKNFQQAEKDLKQYIDFIRKYAQKIDSTENEIKASTQSLNSF